MCQKVTLVFDIGKTNKKLFLFDEQFQEVHREYIRFEEIPDDDGFSSENLEALTNWMAECTKRMLNDSRYDVRHINFSTYGASLVHLDKNGNIAVPFYNYLKPFPDDLEKQFRENYDAAGNFSLNTASPWLGFLNSGLQLYYLKYKKPELFKRLHKSVHFPQYLSYLLTKKLVTDPTSLGCHTGLWDFNPKKYASWVIEEGLEEYFPPILNTDRSYQVQVHHKTVNVGVGVHDSSASLIPYIRHQKEPFVLISTGTWSICINPFNQEPLTQYELDRDCLNFLGIGQHPIKASRLFLGQELREQAMMLGKYFGCDYHSHKNIAFDDGFKPMGTSNKHLMFKCQYLNPSLFGHTEPKETQWAQFSDFEQAYHQLMHELTEFQLASLKLAIGTTEIKKIFIDGGFADNEVFTGLLAWKLPTCDICSAQFALGSALGAALLVNGHNADSGIFEKQGSDPNPIENKTNIQ